MYFSGHLKDLTDEELRIKDIIKTEFNKDPLNATCYEKAIPFDLDMETITKVHNYDKSFLRASVIAFKEYALDVLLEDPDKKLNARIQDQPFHQAKDFFAHTINSGELAVCNVGIRTTALEYLLMDPLKN